MKDEIKKILDGLNQITTENKESKNPLKCTLISFEVLYKLLDYITNLQKEVNKLTAESTEWESKCYNLQEENERLNTNIQELQNCLDYIGEQLNLEKGSCVEDIYGVLGELKRYKDIVDDKDE